MAEISEIISACLARKPSDILLVPGEPPMVRLDGSMERLAYSSVLDPNECRRLIYSMLQEPQRVRFEAAGELDFSYIHESGVNLRVNIYIQRNGVAASLRPIPQTIPRYDQLGLQANIMSLTNYQRGLVLVTGPTGSGKSTTLASMVQYINETKKKHIVTIEDPVEYLYQNKNSIIDQREVGRHTTSFAQALKYSLRQNPDIILIGEMRDLETMELAIRAAETGHLCFSTLHTRDAPSTIGRIISEYPADQREKACIGLSGSLAGVICQNMLPRKSGGRVCAREVMIMNPAIATLIRENRLHQIYGVLENSMAEGMCSMDQSLASLTKEGELDFQEALKHTRDAKNFRALIASGPAGAPPAGAPSAGPPLGAPAGLPSGGPLGLPMGFPAPGNKK